MINCKICKLQFETASKLASHMRWNHKVLKSFKCEKCDIDFKDKSGWANHIKYCKGPKEKKINRLCPKCGYIIKRQFERHVINCNGKGTRRNQRKTSICDLTQYTKTDDGFYICDKCNESFKANIFVKHIKLCNLTVENIEKIKRLYYENVPIKLIRQQNNFSKRDIRIVLKNCVKRTKSDVIKKSHKDGRMNCWKFKESYPEKFFNKFLENSGFVNNKDYLRQCTFSFYRTDFFFPKINLVIEIDGSQHQRYKHQQESDSKKDQLLKSLDIDVMRIQWKNLYHNSKNVLDNVLEILKNKDQITTNNINIFNKQQLDKFNELNKQQFFVCKNKLNLESIQLLANPISKEQLKQKICKLFKDDKLSIKKIAKLLKIKRIVVKILLNELELRIRSNKLNYKNFNLIIKNKIKHDTQLLINLGLTINEISQKLQLNKNIIEMIINEFFKWDRLTKKYRTFEDLKNDINNRINDVKQINLQIRGSIELLSHKWNVSHTEVRRFINKYVNNTVAA